MKKILSMFLTVCLIITVCPLGTFSVTVSASTTNEFLGGTGTAEDPFLISNKNHLNNVRKHLDANYKMVADVVFTEADFAIGGNFYNNGYGWEPIGSNVNNAFMGVFDGNGYSIKNLNINIENDIENGSDIYVGLFGYVKSSTIKNLSIHSSEIIAILESSVFVGGIAGRIIDSTIINCSNIGNIKAVVEPDHLYVGGITGHTYNNSSISNCFYKGNITSQGATCYVGGITGCVYGSTNAPQITGCFNLGDISSVARSSYRTPTYVDAGGIVGYVCYGAIISNCYNVGDMLSKTNYHVYPSSSGGIVGHIDVLNAPMKITRCHNAGNISATHTSFGATYSGGIVGQIRDKAEIESCYNTGDISAEASSKHTESHLSSRAFSGGIVGHLYEGSIFNSYNSGKVFSSTASKYSSSFAGGIVGYEDYKSNIDKCYNIGDISSISPSSKSFVGGIAGSVYSSSTINHSYYSESTSNGVGSGIDECVKCDLSGMRKQITFVGFDFDEVWFINNGEYSFPQLQDNSHYKTSSIEITAKPTKTIYLEGDSFDATGMIVTANYNNNMSTTIKDYTIRGYDSTPGKKNIIVSYDGKSASFEAEVIPLSSIAVTTKPNKITYLEGDEFDVSGMVITAYYNSYTSVVVTDYTISGYDSTPGKKTILVKWKGKSTSFEVEVVDKQCTSIKITTKPNKLIYFENDAFDKTGMVITAYYDNGTNEVVTDYVISGFDSTAGTKTITVNYGGKTATFSVQVFHLYTNDCDVDCNICEFKRVTSHVYDDDSDINCNECGYTRPSYTITFNGNEQIGVPTSIIALEDVEILLPYMDCTSYQFLGWSKTPYGELDYKKGASLTMVENVTLYAKWASNCYHCNNTGKITETNYAKVTCTTCGGDGEISCFEYRCTSCYSDDIEQRNYGGYYGDYCNSCKALVGIARRNRCSSCYGDGYEYGYITTTKTCTQCSGKGFRSISQVRAPQPQLASKTATSVTLVQFDGVDYSMGGETWQESNVFENLTPGIKYKFYMRYKANDIHTIGDKGDYLYVITASSGDIDGVEGITDRDAVHLLYHTFLPDLYPVNQDCDFNGDGEVNDKDAVYLLYYTFLPDLYPID